MASTNISIILLNYHGMKDTIECIHSLGSYKVVVVNISDKQEASTEGEQIKKQFPHIDVVESANLGFSGGNNVGAAYALKHHRPTYLMFLNNDTRVDTDTVAQLVAASERNQDVLAVYSPKIYFESGCEYHHEAYKSSERGKVIWYAGGLEDKKDVYGWHRGVDEVDLGQFDVEQSTGFATGCCMFMTADTYIKVGPWDEKYFLYFEDMDYSTRVRRHKGKVMHVPTAHMWHKNAGSSGGSGSLTHAYYQTRNRLYYGLKYARLNTKFALVKHYLHESKRNTQYYSQALWDVLLRKMGKRIHA